MGRYERLPLRALAGPVEAAYLLLALPAALDAWEAHECAPVRAAAAKLASTLEAEQVLQFDIHIEEFGHTTALLRKMDGSERESMEVPASREEFKVLQEMGFQWDWTLPQLIDQRTVAKLRAACEADAQVECQGPTEFRGVYVDGARRFVVFESTVVSDRGICYEYDTLARRFTRKFRLPMV